MDGSNDTATLIKLSADRVRSAAGIQAIDLAVVLGSGWSQAVSALGAPLCSLPYHELPAFDAPAVLGHSGVLSVVDLGGRAVACFSGRTHLYENRGLAPVLAAVRLTSALSAKRIVLTNGCGSTREDFTPGTPVLISDHINLTGTSPLSGPVFVDCTDVYSPRLRSLARAVRPSLAEGVYAQFRGPQYETPAEVRMAATIGADLVGMSTAVEAIEARRLGLEVLGLSLVTNLAAGVSPQPLDHREVLETGAASAPALAGLLADLCPALCALDSTSAGA